MKNLFCWSLSLLIILIASCDRRDRFVPEPVPSYVETEDYVDLGLDGLLFATKNVGAKNPEDAGGFFAWGEVKPKSYYDWKTYKWANPATEREYIYDEVTFSRYSCPWDGTPDYPFLQPEDDAATVILGEGWRTPTFEEMIELLKCEYRRAVRNGVFGFEYIGPNGNSIFLPACGDIVEDHLINVEYGAKYWCSDCPTGTSATLPVERTIVPLTISLSLPNRTAAILFSCRSMTIALALY